ncbi:hypothetical protein [Streptomyces sp. NPDC002851]
MTGRFKRLATVAATSSLAFGGVMAIGSPAQAAEKCSSHTFVREFDTPGENIDVEYTFCVSESHGVYNGMGYGRVLDGGGTRKVDKFVVESRLEKNNRPVQTRRCDYTNGVNSRDVLNIDCTSPGGRERPLHRRRPHLHRH